MRHVITNIFSNSMYFFEIELLLKERLGHDLGFLLLSFIKEDPKPHIWTMLVLEPSPWDWSKWTPMQASTFPSLLLEPISFPDPLNLKLKG